MEFYEAKPGMWLVRGVSLEEHRAAMAANWTPEDDWWMQDAFMEFDSAEAEYLYYQMGDPPCSRDTEKIWRTADGETIPYGEISDRHLANIMNLIRQWEDQDLLRSYFPNLYAEVERRKNTSVRRGWGHVESR